MSNYSNEQLLKDEMLVCNLADFFDIFGDTSRIKILLALQDKPLPVSTIAELTGLSPSAVSHHLSLLRGRRVVKVERKGKYRVYELDDDHVSSVLKMAISHIQEVK
ncbi:MAG TPA: metalloregulator ArsR/SmtB family transcription factor [Coprothermobacter proteolyticus]|uniref:ArsR/SmtB family transcription factor n=1 Tax=Coprothermobacter proteolyticus TaxID=35786 RepID=UPI000D30CC04|nr:metalloregulator ArsR/SmtB family transcription factor [Coprothermobacter proteolyticus]NLT84128.1 helix-turn-helix transcriptional regulator [Coprothermobacter proteolyticus]HOA65311.1 metalloregulator ArsR/SmtB family transcription factor [Coprothermobacter proteolyticus]